MARGEGDVGDGGDAIERFAAEAERFNAVQVFCRVQLTGGVALEGERRFGGGDAVAVVAHAQQALPALAHLDADFACAGVEAVLDQLLGDIGRPFDDLAGGDFGRDIGRKDMDCHAG